MCYMFLMLDVAICSKVEEEDCEQVNNAGFEILSNVLCERKYIRLIW